MNKIIFFLGITLFIVGVAVLVVTGEFSKELFSFGIWFWMSFSGWILVVTALSMGSDEKGLKSREKNEEE